MNTEYIDSLDEAAYISSLEQQNRELAAALNHCVLVMAAVATGDLRTIKPESAALHHARKVLAGLPS
jgi:hypothetical protein